MDSWLRNSHFSLASSSFVYLFLFANVSVYGGDCSYSNCTNYRYSSTSYINPGPGYISFPFRTPDQAQRCGLPGFELGCNNSIGIPILSFASGQSFEVQYIFDSSRAIQIGDGGHCLQEKLMHFNSSGTPFYSAYFTKFTLYTCPMSVDLRDSLLSFSCRQIGCDRGRYNPVVCDVDQNTSLLVLNYGCDLIGDVKVAGNWASAYIFSGANSADLTWDMPRECVECKSMGQDCGRDLNNYTRIKCFPRRPSSVKGLATAVTILIALPIVLVFASACYICCTRTQNPVGQTHFNTQSSTNRESYGTSGLLQATLDTYPILLIGDSGRILMNMQDIICPICLSDFKPGDVLRYLPECLHRFHSDCIDEWLRTKGMCPVCRAILP